ncbi:hypothetical protein HDU88_000036 [Geranomyces variabilis]|nr:hypothetical protein HDU88_000036 [Geranomyces variabilis]
MPGVYVSDPPPPPPESPLLDNLEYLGEEIARLRRSVEMLLNSNRELQPHADDDPEFAQAIAENVGVIARQVQLIQKYETRVDELTRGATHGADKPCKKESLPVVVMRHTVAAEVSSSLASQPLPEPPAQASAADGDDRGAVQQSEQPSATSPDAEGGIFL